MAATAGLPPGITAREYTRADGTVTTTYSVRFKDEFGAKRRRTFDSVDDALDFLAKRRSAKRWRPEELRLEARGQTTLAEFFARWWREYALVELGRKTLEVYRCLWEAHVEPRLGPLPLSMIDVPRVVAFRGELLEAGVGRHSIVKTMSMVQAVFRDALEAGEVAFNPFKLVKKPSPGPGREARPFTPLQVEALRADIVARGYGQAGVLVRLLAYTGMRPQEALGLHWYAVGDQTLLVEEANTDGELQPLKNRKRSRRRSRSVDMIKPVREDLAEWRRESGGPPDSALVFPHEVFGDLWLDEQYRTWRRRIYVPSAENIGMHSVKPYDLRHTWASLLIAEKRLSIAEIAEQLGDKTSTILDTYTHVIREWRGRRAIDIEREIRKARTRHD